MRVCGREELEERREMEWAARRSAVTTLLGDHIATMKEVLWGKPFLESFSSTLMWGRGGKKEHL